MDRESLMTIRSAFTTSRSTSSGFERDHEIAWSVLGQIKPQISDTSTAIPARALRERPLVSRYYDWSAIDPVWRMRTSSR